MQEHPQSDITANILSLKNNAALCHAGTCTSSRWHLTYKLIDLPQRCAITVSVTYYIFEQHNDVYSDSLSHILWPEGLLTDGNAGVADELKSVHCCKWILIPWLTPNRCDKCSRY